MAELTRLIADIRYPARFSLPFIGFEDKRLEWTVEQRAFVRSLCEVFTDTVPMELVYADLIVAKLAEKGGPVHELWCKRWPEQYRTKLKNFMSSVQATLRTETASGVIDKPTAKAMSDGKEEGDEEGEGGVRCCICLERVSAAEWFQVTGHWSEEEEAPIHSMHHGCASQWFRVKKNCPLCKRRWRAVRWTDEQQTELLEVFEKTDAPKPAKTRRKEQPRRVHRVTQRQEEASPATPKRRASPASHDSSFSDPVEPASKVARTDRSLLLTTKRSLLHDLSPCSPAVASSSSTQVL